MFALLIDIKVAAYSIRAAWRAAKNSSLFISSSLFMVGSIIPDQGTLVKFCKLQLFNNGIGCIGFDVLLSECMMLSMLNDLFGDVVVWGMAGKGREIVVFRQEDDGILDVHIVELGIVKFNPLKPPPFLNLDKLSNSSFTCFGSLKRFLLLKKLPFSNISNAEG